MFNTDIGFPGKATGLNYGPSGGSLSRNVHLESHSPGLSGSSNSAVGISDSSSVTIQELECKNDSLDKPPAFESHGSSRYKRRRKITVQGSMRHASLDLQNPDELDDDDPLLSTMLLNKSGKNLGEASKIGASRREKRLRKPTQRYIEELSDKKKYFKGQGKFSAVAAASMKDKRLKVRSADELHPMKLGTLSSVPEEELPGETKNQVVTEFRPRRGRPKKQASISVGKLATFCVYFLFIPFVL